MPLKDFMTATASTYRRPVQDAKGKRGDHVLYLENVKVVPVMLPQASGQHNARQASGLDGTSVFSHGTYTESHEHDKEGAPVTEMPDIRASDLVVVNGITYSVKRAALEGITSMFGQTLYVYMDLDNNS